MVHQGIVVMYHQTKHWGFVKEESGAEWFFHLDNCASGFQPQLGAAVDFEIAPPISLGKKDQAVDVRPVGSAQ
jgi:cold shock CspA family protein